MNDPSLDLQPPAGPAQDPFQEGPTAARARRWRSLAIAVALIAFVAVVFTSTIIRLAGNMKQVHAHTPVVATHRPASIS